ncbi:hypothetical protein ACQY0O_005441 [Thecaphora frezii]
MCSPAPTPSPPKQRATMFTKSISSPVSREVLEPAIREAPQPVHRGGHVLRQLRHWRANLTSAIRSGKRRREDEEPKTHGGAYEPGQLETGFIGMPDEYRLSLNFSPERRLSLDLTVSPPSPTASPIPSLSNGSDVTPATTPSAEILTFGDAAATAAATAASVPSPASSPRRRLRRVGRLHGSLRRVFADSNGSVSSPATFNPDVAVHDAFRRRLRRVGRLPPHTTSTVSPGHDEAPVYDETPVSLQDDKVDALADIFSLPSLEDDTASVIDLDIQRQSIESNIVDPAFIPTTHRQDDEEEPQHTDDAPLDDLETVYDEDEDEACFLLDDPVDVASWDDEDGDENDNAFDDGFDLETVYDEDEDEDEVCFLLDDPVNVFAWDEEEEAPLTLHEPIPVTAWDDDKDKDDIAANLPERPSAPIPFIHREDDDENGHESPFSLEELVPPTCRDDVEIHNDDKAATVPTQASSSALGTVHYVVQDYHYRNKLEDDDDAFSIYAETDDAYSIHVGEEDNSIHIEHNSYFLEHDASLATTIVREIDEEMEPSSDSSDSSHYDDLLELISSFNLSDSDNTEPMDEELLPLVEPMEEEPLPLPGIQINGIPLHLLDDAWEHEPEQQHQHQHEYEHQHEYVCDAAEQSFWSDDSDETEPTVSWACTPTPLPSAFRKCANEELRRKLFRSKPGMC